MLKRVLNISLSSDLHENLKLSIPVYKSRNMNHKNNDDSFTSSSVYDLLSKTGLVIEKIESDGKLFRIKFSSGDIFCNVSAEQEMLSNLKFINYKITYKDCVAFFKIKFNSQKFNSADFFNDLKGIRTFFKDLLAGNIQGKKRIADGKELDSLLSENYDNLIKEFSFMNNLFLSVISRYLNLNLKTEYFKNNENEDLIILLEVLLPGYD